jgi:hypothetical protein
MITQIISRNGKETGTLTGGKRQCQMEGCYATRIGVRWPDGKLTFPCSAGMKTVKRGKKELYKII